MPWIPEMSPKEVMLYMAKKSDPFQMLYYGMNDYLGGRCCILNGLPHQGSIMNAQGVEKALKAQIRLRGDKEKFRSLSHNIVKMSKMLIAEYGFDLHKYLEIIEKLNYHYNHRYPRLEEEGNVMELERGWDFDELHETDELMFFLFENMPVPDEVKYCCGMYTILFNRQRIKVPNGAFNCLINENITLPPYLPRMVQIIKDNYGYFSKILRQGREI
jgi:hypothetical protein